MHVLERTQWRPRAEEHRARVDDLIGPYLDRRRHGHRHPVLDFLFTYYSSRPAHIQRWHPGLGVVLADADDYLRLRGYTRLAHGVTADPDELDRRQHRLVRLQHLLAATESAPARLGCMGLHEWAMVYRTDRPRHDLPLRLGAAGSDAVVESLPLKCTHYDAFRFFTEPARPRNETRLSRETQAQHEQPGCLHTTMDLYRACLILTPFIDAGLTLRAFEVALQARELDMRAGPYDLGDFGYAPVPIETPAGRATYVREQSEISRRGSQVRRELLRHCRDLVAVAETPGHEADQVADRSARN